MNINLAKVLEEIGGVASDTTDYSTIRETWNPELSSAEKCPPFFVFADVWKQMVYSGRENGTWKQEREKAYHANNIHLSVVNDLIMEYSLAVISGNQNTIDKYQHQLATIQAKRESIKSQFPKVEN